MPVKSLKDLKSGGKAAMAEVLAAAEHSAGQAQICNMLDAAYLNPKAQVAGFTGPPGVGKSTLVNALIKKWREKGLSVGVIAVDPSSHATGGALLGDRTRMITDPDDKDVFVRSLAARGKLGGLSELTYSAVVLMRAVYDMVVVESVGVGQSEADISSVADTVVLCIQPGSGDSLQFMKAGIMEIPHIAVVTKSDFGAPARRALADLEGGISLSAGDRTDWQVQVLPVSATSGEGLDSLVSSIATHFEWLCDGDRLDRVRLSQAELWLKSSIFSRYGSEGLSKVQKLAVLKGNDGPFSRVEEISNKLVISLQTED